MATSESSAPEAANSSRRTERLVPRIERRQPVLVGLVVARPAEDGLVAVARERRPLAHDDPAVLGAPYVSYGRSVLLACDPPLDVDVHRPHGLPAHVDVLPAHR